MGSSEISYIMNSPIGIEEKLDNISPGSRSGAPHGALKRMQSREFNVRLEAILQQEGNKVCADCTATHPTWAIVTHGGLICFKCAGIHRSLGVHISFVLSCRLDKLTQVQLEKLEAVGNLKLNEELEFDVPRAFKKPNASTSLENRRRYIVAKYNDQRFKVGPHKVRLPPTHELGGKEASPKDAAGMIEYKGILKIQLLKAQGITISKVHDPFVTFKLGGQTINSKKGKKQKIGGLKTFTWDEGLMLPWNGKDELMVELHARRQLSRAWEIGASSVSLDTLSELLDNDQSNTLDILQPMLHTKGFGRSIAERKPGSKGVRKGIAHAMNGMRQLIKKGSSKEYDEPKEDQPKSKDAMRISKALKV